MKTSPDPWTRLAAAARSAPAVPPPEEDPDADRKISRRAVRLWLQPPAPRPVAHAAPVSAIWEAWTFRGLAAAGVVAAVALALNLSALNDELDPDELSLDPVAGLLANL